MKDSIIPALSVQQGKTSDSYVVRSRIKGGSVVAVTIGKTSVWSLQQARKEAKTILLELSQGINRNQLRKQRQAEEAVKAAKAITLRQALAKYLEMRPVKDTTKREYRLVVEREFRAWLDKPITSITKQMIQQRYVGIINDIKAGKTPSKGKTNTSSTYTGVGAANHAKRILSAVLGFFVDEDGDDAEAVLTANPVKILHKKRLVRSLKPRTKIINGNERRCIIEEASNVRHPEYEKDGNGLTVNEADFTVLLMLLACRREELVKLKWVEVRFPMNKDDVGTVTFTNTKNGIDHTLVMTPVVLNILKGRKAENKTKSEWVFPSKQANKIGKHLSCGKLVENVSKKLGIEGLTAHVLRRTTADIALELGFDMTTIKQLLNHSSNDVTQKHYLNNGKKRLLEMQLQIENEIVNNGEPDWLPQPENER